MGRIKINKPYKIKPRPRSDPRLILINEAPSVQNKQSSVEKFRSKKTKKTASRSKLKLRRSGNNKKKHSVSRSKLKLRRSKTLKKTSFEDKIKVPKVKKQKIKLRGTQFSTEV